MESYIIWSDCLHWFQNSIPFIITYSKPEVARKLSHGAWFVSSLHLTENLSFFLIFIPRDTTLGGNAKIIILPQLFPQRESKQTTPFVPLITFLGMSSDRLYTSAECVLELKRKAINNFWNNIFLSSFKKMKFLLATEIVTVAKASGHYGMEQGT